MRQENMGRIFVNEHHANPYRSMYISFGNRAAQSMQPAVAKQVRVSEG